MLTDDEGAFDAVEAVRQPAEDAKAAIRYAAGQLPFVIDPNFLGLDTKRIENLAIEFAYRLFMSQ